MPDREKVIKGLECCIEDGCRDCPYFKKCDMFDGYLSETLLKDVLEVLKEQEAVKPTPGMLCGQCGCRIYQDANYCYNCGRKVKWDD